MSYYVDYGVWEGLRFVIGALPELFSHLLLYYCFYCIPYSTYDKVVGLDKLLYMYVVAIIILLCTNMRVTVLFQVFAEA